MFDVLSLLTIIYIYIYITIILTKINKHKQSVAKKNVTMRLDNGEKLSL